MRLCSIIELPADVGCTLTIEYVNFPTRIVSFREIKKGNDVYE